MPTRHLHPIYCPRKRPPVLPRLQATALDEIVGRHVLVDIVAAMAGDRGAALHLSAEAAP